MANNSHSHDKPTNKVFIYLKNDGSVTWYCCNGEIISGENESFDVDELNNVITKETDITLIVSSFDIHFKTISLPNTVKKNSLPEMIKYKCEDELADDIESLQFFVLEEFDTNVFSVAIVSNTICNTWRNILNSFNAKHKQVIPDIFILPLENDTWSILITETVVMIRTNSSKGFCWEKLSFNSLLKKLLHEVVTKPKKIHIYSTNTALSELDTLLAQMNIPTEIHTNTSLENLITHHPSKEAEFRLTTKQEYHYFGSVQSQIKVTAYVIIAFLSLLLLTQVSKLTAVYFINNKFYHQAEQVSHALRPDAENLEQAKKEISDALNSENGNQNGFMQLLLLSGKILKELPPDNIQSILFDNNTLTLNLSVNNFKELSTLKLKLQNQGLSVVQNSAETQRNRVVTQLAVSMES